MELFIILSVVAVIVIACLVLDNKEIKMDYVDLIKERDDLRRKLKIATKNDGRDKIGQYAGRGKNNDNMPRKRRKNKKK